MNRPYGYTAENACHCEGRKARGNLPVGYLVLHSRSMDGIPLIRPLRGTFPPEGKAFGRQIAAPTFFDDTFTNKDPAP